MNKDRISTAYFAGGCFWGVEHLLQQLPGVIEVTSGYMGGNKANPTYEEVKTGMTGHAETVKVTYNSDEIDYETIAKAFFEIHDPTQADGQGPDLGNQYRSEIFYNSEKEREIAEKLIAILKNKGYDVVTEISPASIFWKAEEYHQNYYEIKGAIPYCHIYTKRF